MPNASMNRCHPVVNDDRDGELQDLGVVEMTTQLGVLLVTHRRMFRRQRVGQP